MTRPPRLKKRASFLQAARKGRKCAMPGLVLQALPHDTAAEREHPKRVGFTVTRKVGNAVERNRIKRRLRAVADEILPAEARDGFDFVLIGRQGTLTRPHTALKRDLQVALKRVGAGPARSSASGTDVPSEGNAGRAGKEAGHHRRESE